MNDLIIVLLVILVLVILWRGPRNLPRLGEAAGRAISELRNQARRGDEGEADASPPATPASAPPRTPPSDGGPST